MPSIESLAHWPSAVVLAPHTATGKANLCSCESISNKAREGSLTKRQYAVNANREWDDREACCNSLKRTLAGYFRRKVLKLSAFLDSPDVGNNTLRRFG